MNHDAGLGPVGLDADRAGEHGVGAEALAQHGEVVEPVQQRQHQLGSTAMRSSAACSPAALVATISASTGSSRRATARGWATNSPKLTLSTRRPRSEISCGGRLPGHDDHRRARPLEHAREQSAHAAGAEHRDLHGSGSISTPGFIIPRGSTAAFAPRSARGERLRSLPVIPGPVIAPDGVVVGDRAALGDIASEAARLI